MKDWCLQHPYLTFFIVMSLITTIGNMVTKLIEIFVKPSPTTVNMNIDPTKMPGYHVADQDDGALH